MQKGDVEGQEADKGIREEEEITEARTPKIARVPKTPTKADVEAHFPLHLEYREWCPHCVAGKGQVTPHKRGTGEERLGTTISVDYCFMVPEERSEELAPILLGYDDSTKSTWTMRVDHKGPTEGSVKWMTGKIEAAGHAGQKITMKSDQEDAIMALKKAIAVRRQANTAMIESPVRESKSNGRVEGAIKIWQGQYRTLRHQAETRMRKKIPRDSPLNSWLIGWTSEVMCKYKIHSDGRTSYELSTGHRFKMSVCGFAEKVHFKTATDKNHRNKLDTDWNVGYFLGTTERSNEYLVGTSSGITACSTIKRMTDDLAYDASCIEEVGVTYSEYICDGATTTNPRVRFASPAQPNPNPMSVGLAFAPRRMKIGQADLEKVGYIIGCPGCEWAQSQVGPRRAHSEECRTRVEV